MMDRDEAGVPIRRIGRRARAATPDGEARRFLEAMRRVHAATTRRSPDARALMLCAARAQRHIGLPDAALPGPLCQDGDVAPTSVEWRRLGDHLASCGQHLTPSASQVDRWTPGVARAIGLNAAEADILGFALAYGQDRHVETLWDELSDGRGRESGLGNDPELFALLLGLPEPDIRTCLSPTGRLRESGLLSEDGGGGLSVLPRLRALLARRRLPQGDVRGLLMSAPRAAKLPWEAFAHLGEPAELAAKLLAAAIAAREPGVGILLYGPVGTGKTEFAAALAARAGAVLHPVGETDDEGDEPTAEGRLAELRLSQRLLGDSSSALLFDEAEDLFTCFGFEERRARSKVFLNQLLDRSRAPVIWTANDVAVLGKSVVRRMMLCIEVRQPGVEVRTRLLREIALAEGVALDEAAADSFARDLPAAPAIVRNALRGARLVDGDARTALLIASGIARAVAGGALPAPEPGLPADYDPALIQADCDLAELARTLARTDAQPAPTLLLCGPSGCGKTAYVRHLAAQMRMPVLLRRASDLLGMYVGQSERNIAAAFAQARDEGAFLVFDEADSLLADRRGAQRGWEVSQVNEMLTWMESHPLPFACTTNLDGLLDPASLRRFLFKVRFGYLRPDQAELAFTRFFGAQAPADLSRVHELTPADFALVRRRAAFLHAAPDADAIVRMLAAETNGRGGLRNIGFQARVADRVGAC